MTTATLLTPSGQGAIATIRIRGDQAVVVVESLFASATNRKLSAQPVGKILFGEWQSTASEREELVVCRTGEDEIEVQCHGGPAAVRAILRSVENKGCQIVEWQDEISSDDLIAAECRVALASATTERTAGILLAQLNGRLKSGVEDIVQLLDSDLLEATTRIDALLDRSAVGMHLTAPWRVVIAGPPNVGKSSLINALLGFERAIVFDQPGTTRDVVASVTAFDGWPVSLSDTAGIRHSKDVLEMAGIEMAQEQISRADLVVQVHAADQFQPGLDDIDVGRRKSITVVNKCDLAVARSFPNDVVQTIATKPIGIDRLISRVVETLHPNPPNANDAVPFTARQVEQLEGAKRCLQDKNIQATRQSLLAILSQR